ncbi:hypothetical protein [Thioalkalivibrio thiocyanodenitrificans]|nr:hypothetical protein [Thioalkalivibrio thiocyanodenitrificans]
MRTAVFRGFPPCLASAGDFFNNLLGAAYPASIRYPLARSIVSFNR